MNFSRHDTFFFIVILVLTVCCPLRAQHTLKKLSGDDYGRWGNLRLNQISADGMWVSFSMAYPSKRDTLFIRQAQGDKSFAIAGGQHGFFAINSQFVYDTADGLRIIELDNGRITELGPVSKFELTHDRSRLIYMAKGSGGDLSIRNLKKNADYQLNGISEYNYCPASGNLAAVSLAGGTYTIRILDFTTGSDTLICRGKGLIPNSLVWQKDGSSLAYAERDNGDRIFSYDMLRKKKHILNLEKSGLIKGEISLIPKQPAFSHDGKKLSFYIRPFVAGKASADAGPEVWNTFDKELYPAKAATHGWRELPKLAVWSPENSTTQMMTDTINPYVMVSSDYNHALLWNPLDIEPDHTDSRSHQYTIWDLRKDVREPLIKSPGTWTVFMSTSPDGRFVTYFDGQDWIAYEFSSGTSYNLTASLPVSFATEKDGKLTVIPFSSPGWDSEGNFIMYDSYDIWAINPGKPARKLTDGRKAGLRYRIAVIPEKEMGQSNYNGSRSLVVDRTVPLLLELSKNKSGYAVLLPNGKIAEMAAGSRFFSQGVISGDGKKLYCLRQDYSTPPHLLYYDNGGRESKIFESNSHYRQYGIQHMETIHYTTEKGERLKGSLYYPLSFDKTKKYPVIVHIYEDQSWQAERYINPSSYNPTGFNVSNFTGDGYFVFLPNIVYGCDNPGDDALRCVAAAVNEISGRYYIDSGKIGLIGHSFGGYGTNYILGHCGLFATAVSGSPINDMALFYHYVMPGIFRPNFFNMENGQFRMPFPYHEQPFKYLEASPLYTAGKIKAPLISWTGKEDMQIDQTQIKAFYLALRRTGKPHVMLLYPSEGHLIYTRSNQCDLTQKIAQWFGYYLKGLPAPEWADANYDE